MGGAVAQMAAASCSERVAGLILIGTGARLRVAPAILKDILDDQQTAVDLIMRWAWAEDAPEHLVRQGQQTWMATPAEIVHGDFMACDAFDMMEQLTRIMVPTLVIVGTADRLTPHKYGVFLQQHIPNSRLVTVDGGGHMMALEQPRVVAGAVAEFLQGL
jgi:pimeloyl-ACP methyl ester carboxylesterase